VIGVRSLAREKDFSSNLCVQTGSEAHPASCTMGTGVLPRGKGRSGRDADHSPPVQRSGMSSSYNSPPPSASMACSGTALLCFALPHNTSLTVFSSPDITSVIQLRSITCGRHFVSIEEDVRETYNMGDVGVNKLLKQIIRNRVWIQLA
jgi:hypothetical protein